MSLRSDLGTCQDCGGGFPNDVPDDLVCTCGANWGQPSLVPVWVPALRQAIGTLAEMLDRPGPPDPAPQDHEETL